MDHHEEMRLLKRIAKTGLSPKPLGFGVKDTQSLSILIDVTDFSTRFFCKRYSSRNEQAFSYGTEHLIRGNTGITKAVVRIYDENSVDPPDPSGQGIGECWVNSIPEKVAEQASYEFEGAIFLSREVLLAMQNALAINKGTPNEIELTVSVPTETFLKQHNFLWVERLAW